MVNWSSVSGRRFPVFSTTLPIDIRRSTGGVMTKPLIMGLLLIHGLKKADGAGGRLGRVVWWYKGGLYRSADEEASAPGLADLITGFQFRVVGQQSRSIDAHRVSGLLPADAPVC